MSYVPEKPRAKSPEPRIWTLDAGHLTLDSKVGVPGFEPGTSALSELRSNQLSYKPNKIIGMRDPPFDFDHIRQLADYSLERR